MKAETKVALRTKSVTNRLLVFLAVLGLCVTSTALTVTWQFTRDAEMQKLDSRLEQIAQSLIPAMAVSMWTLDEDVLQLQAQSMLSIDDVIGVDISWAGQGDKAHLIIRDEAQSSLFNTAEAKDLLLIKEFPAIYARGGDAKPRLVGHIKVTISLLGVHSTVLAHARFNAIILLLNFLLIATAVFFLMRYLLSRHIVDIADYARHLNLKSLSEPLELKRKQSMPLNTDELDDVVNAINSMRQSLIDDLALQKNMQTALEYEQEISRTTKVESEVARKSSETKSLFLANMSHEIRTPMNSIIGFLDLSLEHELSTSLRDYLGTASRSARALLTIINDILDVSKFESGKVDLESIAFNLPSVLKDSLKTLETNATAKGLSLKLDYPSTLPSSFMGDPSRLRQVFINLVGNAIKFTSEGSVSIAVSMEDEDMLRFEIKDTGIGMSEAQCEKVFDSFQQADNATSRKFGGTGLGTTISKQIVELMGGRIWIESQLGEGSVFYFTAHLPPSHETIAECLPAQPYLETMSPAPRVFNILLAEDIRENARLAMFRLEQQGHQVTWADNGQKTVDCIQAQHADFDLILMDVQMPVLDGLAATACIRQFEALHELAKIPIIALTASVLNDDRALCFEAGMANIVGKPIDFPELFAVMESVVAEGRGQIGHKASAAPEEEYEAGAEHHGTINFACLYKVANIERGLSIWGDAELYATSLKSFAQAQRQGYARFYTLVTQENYVELQAQAHAIKGVSANLCLETLSGQMASIERLAKTNSKQDLVMQLSRLKTEFDDCLAAIDTLECVDRIADQFSENIDIEFSQDEFISLHRAFQEGLEELNPDNALAALVSMVEIIDGSRLNAVRQCLQEFDFDGASTAMKTLVTELNNEGLLNRVA